MGALSNKQETKKSRLVVYNQENVNLCKEKRKREHKAEQLLPQKGN